MQTEKNMTIFDDINKSKNKILVFVNGEFVSYENRKILNSLLDETNIDKDSASFIVSMVDEKIKLSKINIMTPRMIRGLVSSILIENGLMDIHRDYTTIGIPVNDIERLISTGDRENANIDHNPQSISGKISDLVLKDYFKKHVIPQDIVLAHEKREIHIHKLEFYGLGMFCQAWDPRIILLYGLPPTTKLKTYKTSKTTSDMRTACIHLANWFSYAQSVFSGGQGYIGFNTILAPYAERCDDKELWRALQSFVFQVNQQRDSRGHQLPFTSIDINFGIDPTFKDCHAVYDGEFLDRRYSDFEEQSVRILDKLIDIFYAGDKLGIPFSFPKFEIKVTNKGIEKYPHIWEKILKLISHNGSPYIMNGNILPESVHCQCCRIIFNPDGDVVKFCVDPEKFKPTDTNFPNFGSHQPASINMPRLAIDSGFNIDESFNILDERLKLIERLFLQKREIVNEMKTVNFPSMYWIKIGDAGKELIDLDLQSMTLGFVGMNELVENLIGKHIASKEGHDLAKRFLNYLDSWCLRKSVEHKMMINLWEQPAESTAHRFAMYDYKKYSNLNITVQGKDGRYYYSNSDHIPYSYNVPLDERIRLQGEFHPIVKGGVITHIWIGDNKPDFQSLSSLISKILNRTTTYYMKFGCDYTICNDCDKRIHGYYEKCVYCDSEDIDYLAIVTGYLALFSRFNDGKKQEMRDRIRNRI